MNFCGSVVAATLCKIPFFSSPSAFAVHAPVWMQIDGLVGQAEIHRHHGELHAAAALQEDDGVVVGNGEMFAEAGFGGGVDAFKFGRAVAHFHDGHAGAAPVEEFFADALEDGKRKAAGPALKLKARLMARWGGGGAHDGVILSVCSGRRRVRHVPAVCLADQNNRIANRSRRGKGG